MISNKSMPKDHLLIKIKKLCKLSIKIKLLILTPHRVKWTADLSSTPAQTIFVQTKCLQPSAGCCRGKCLCSIWNFVFEKNLKRLRIQGFSPKVSDFHSFIWAHENVASRQISVHDSFACQKSHPIAHLQCNRNEISASEEFLSIMTCTFVDIRFVHLHLLGELKSQTVEQTADIAELSEKHQLVNVWSAVTDDADYIGMLSDGLHDCDFVVKLFQGIKVGENRGAVDHF